MYPIDKITIDRKRSFITDENTRAEYRSNWLRTAGVAFRQGLEENLTGNIENYAERKSVERAIEIEADYQADLQAQDNTDDYIDLEASSNYTSYDDVQNLKQQYGIEEIQTITSEQANELYPMPQGSQHQGSVTNLQAAYISEKHWEEHDKNESLNRYAEKTEGITGSIKYYSSIFLGGLLGGAADPALLAFSAGAVPPLVSGVYSIPKVGNVLQGSIRGGAAIGAGTAALEEIPIQVLTKKNRDALGLQYTSEDFITNMIFAATLGGLFGAGGQFVINKISPTENPKTSPPPNTELNFDKSKLEEDQKVYSQPNYNSRIESPDIDPSRRHIGSVLASDMVFAYRSGTLGNKEKPLVSSEVRDEIQEPSLTFEQLRIIDKTSKVALDNSTEESAFSAHEVFRFQVIKEISNDVLGDKVHAEDIVLIAEDIREGVKAHAERQGIKNTDKIEAYIQKIDMKLASDSRWQIFSKFSTMNKAGKAVTKTEDMKQLEKNIRSDKQLSESEKVDLISALQLNMSSYLDTLSKTQNTKGSDSKSKYKFEGYDDLVGDEDIYASVVKLAEYRNKLSTHAQTQSKYHSKEGVVGKTINKKTTAIKALPLTTDKQGSVMIGDILKVVPVEKGKVFINLDNGRSIVLDADDLLKEVNLHTSKFTFGYDTMEELINGLHDILDVYSKRNLLNLDKDEFDFGVGLVNADTGLGIAVYVNGYSPTPGIPQLYRAVNKKDINEFGWDIVNIHEPNTEISMKSSLNDLENTIRNNKNQANEINQIEETPESTPENPNDNILNKLLKERVDEDKTDSIIHVPEGERITPSTKRPGTSLLEVLKTHYEHLKDC